MDSESVAVVDISSDDEDGDFRRGTEELSSSSSIDWLSEALNKDTGCNSEVMVGDELELLSDAASLVNVEKGGFGKPTEVLSVLDDDDDDCLILDGDPDKPVDIVRDEGGKEEHDEVCIVAEKGQIACRDYPHPRHLCAIFPFSTTPHESYCKQCHCYVCDSLAPCVKWGNGTSSADHCHSTDKEESWKLQRITVKQGTSLKNPHRVNNLGFLVTTGHKSGGRTGQTPERNNFIYQHSTSNGPLPVERMNNMIAQKQIPSSLRRCSNSNFNSSNMISNRCQQQPGIYCREKVLPRSHVSSIPVNHGFQRQSRSLPPRMYPGNLHFKRPGAVRNIAINAYTSGHTDHHARRIPPRRNHNRPVIQSHDFHQSTYPSIRISEGNSQHPQMLSPSSGKHPNYKDMLAGLESHLGLSDDDNIFSDIHPLCIQSSGLTTSSHASSVGLLNNGNYQTCEFPCQPTGYAPFVQCDPGRDWSMVRNSTLPKQKMETPFFIGVSPLPEVQIPVQLTTTTVVPSCAPPLPEVQIPVQFTTTTVVPNCDVASGGLPSADWMSIFEENFTVASTNPTMPLGLSSPELLLPTFDFEDHIA